MSMNRLTKYTAFKVLAVLLLLVSSAYSAESVITDMRGRTVTVPEKVDRIACIGRGALRMVCYLHAAKAVVGVEFPERKKTEHARPYLLAYPYLKQLPSIGMGAKGDPELLLKAAPQVIFYADGSPQAVNTLQDKTGIPVINITCGDLYDRRQDFDNCLRLIADILDRQYRCDSLIQFVDEQIAELSKIAEQNQFKDVSAYIGGLIFKGRQGITSTQGAFTPFQLLGIENVASGLQAKSTNPVNINIEQLAIWSPDVICIDKACKAQVQKDLKTYGFLGGFENMYELYPTRLYGENYETVLVNAFYLAYALTDRSIAEFEAKANILYERFLTPGVMDKVKSIYGLPGPFGSGE